MEVKNIHSKLLKIFFGTVAMCLPIQSVEAQPRMAGLFDFQIKDHKEFYKSFQTPKRNRKKNK